MIRKVKCNKRLKRKCTSWVYACPHLLWYLYEQINQISINRSISTRGNFMLQFFFNELFSTHILVKRDPWCIGKWASFQFRQSVMSDSLQPHGLQHARPPCPSPTPGVHSNSCPLSRWCHPTISSSVIPFSSRLQSFPALRGFSNESTLHIRWPK